MQIARAGRGAGPVSRRHGKRRHHRPADQRALGCMAGAGRRIAMNWRRAISTRCGALCRATGPGRGEATRDPLRPHRRGTRRRQAGGAACSRANLFLFATRRPRARKVSPRRRGRGVSCVKPRISSAIQPSMPSSISTRHDSLASLALARHARPASMCWWKSRRRGPRPNWRRCWKPSSGVDVRVRVGYNHRFHPALVKARAHHRCGRAGAADVRARTLRPWRPGRL